MRKFVSITPALVVLALCAGALVFVPRLMDRYAEAQTRARVSLAREVLAEDDILRRVDRAVASIADSIEPSVVHIETADEDGFRGAYSSGAGWIYDTQGHLVTNAHVVKSARRVTVEFYTGRVVEGSVIGTDVYTDIAVVQVDPALTTFPAVRSGVRLPRVGERIFAFGSPFGFKFSMSEGIVSGLGRQGAGTGILGGYTNYIQTDAAVNPGNSGGPLVNTDGHVIGMNVAIATAANAVGSSPEEAGADSAGISFAIPLGTIEPIVSQIIEHGEVSRGYLGIRFPPGLNERVQVSTDDGESVTGVLVTGVERDGPSWEAGIEPNDVIIGVQGSPVINNEALSSLISSHRAGETIELRIFRAGEIRSIDVTLGKMRDEVLAQRLAQPLQIQMGAVFNSHPDGAIVVQVWQGLPASAAGIGAGDIVTRVNGKSFDSRDTFFVLLADEGLLTGSRVELEVIHANDGTRSTVAIQLK